MKKKLVVALFATVLAFSMTACGSKASAEVVSVSEEAEVPATEEAAVEEVAEEAAEEATEEVAEDVSENEEATEEAAEE